MIVARKYNPGFLTDDELVASFCVRTKEFASIIEVLRECTGRSNSHQIVIGPRGSGKTTLLLRVAAEVRQDPELSSGFFPIVFAEESYEVSTAGEFWLECLSRLAVQAPNREENPDLHRSYEDLRTIQDDRLLAERCLGVLLDFSDQVSKRLVLLVENLNMMFDDMMDRDAGWRLRKILQTEPRIVLLTSATSRFDEIDNPEQALYDLFRVSTLRALDTDECAKLWETVSGQCRPPETIRSLEILTGGSPRLLAMVARFGAELSFRELMADLLDLVDDHTEYFKSHLEALPAQERRVYLALADLWKPATTREISVRARLETSKCSAQLKRLTERGVAQAVGGTARRKQYYLSERLYNIYYLLRRSRGPDNLVEALVRFMEAFYSPHEFQALDARLKREALQFDQEMGPQNQALLERMIEHVARLKDGFEPHDGQSDLPEVKAVESLLDRATALREQSREDEALSVLDDLLVQLQKNETPVISELSAKALVCKGSTLADLERFDDALTTFDDVVNRFGASDVPTVIESVVNALSNKGLLLAKLDNEEQALASFDEVVCQFGEHVSSTVFESVSEALLAKGLTLCEINRSQDALEVFDSVVRRTDESNAPNAINTAANALMVKGWILITINRLEDALDALDETVRRVGESELPSCLEAASMALMGKGLLLCMLDRLEEALIALNEVKSRFGNINSPTIKEFIAVSLVIRGGVLSGLNRLESALATFDEVVDRLAKIDTPGLIEMVSESPFIEMALLAHNQPEDTFGALYETVHRFGKIEPQSSPGPIWIATLCRGLVLSDLNRTDDALAAFEDVIRQCEDYDSVVFVAITEFALLQKVDIELACGQYQAAIGTASRLVDQRLTGSPEKRWGNHLIRAKALLVSGNSSGCEQDIEATLAILAQLESLPKEALDVIVHFSIELGPERIVELVRASPAANLLLPLTTALELELGLEPRVAVEVLEVAQDIRRDIDKLRNSETSSLSRKQAESPALASPEQQSV